MTPPPIVIAGTGRSGTTFLTAALNRLGVTAGHEEFFTIGTPRQDLDVDVSWIAVPYLRTWTGRVFHQVRHPLDVISSFVKKWDRADAFWPTKAAGLLRPEDPQVVFDAMAAWTDYVLQIEARSEWTWRLEDLDAALLAQVAAETTRGAPPSTADAQAVLDSLGTGVNSHGPGARLTWDDLPEGPLRRKTQEIALALWGYN